MTIGAPGGARHRPLPARAARAAPRRTLGRQISLNLGLAAVVASVLLVLVVLRLVAESETARERRRLAADLALLDLGAAGGDQLLKALFGLDERDAFAVVAEPGGPHAVDVMAAGEPSLRALADAAARDPAADGSVRVVRGGLSGTPRVVVGARRLVLAGGGHGLGVARSLTGPLGGARPRAVVGATAVAFTLVAFAFGRALLERSVVAPVRAMRRFAEQVRAGAPGPALEDTGERPEELTVLAESLVAMADQLGARLAELEAANAELARAQQEVVRSERLAAVGRLAAGLAHEVGNPLGAITGLVELLRDGTIEGADADDALRRIDDETRRIRRIVEALLGFARGVGGGRRADARGVVATALELLGERGSLDAVAAVEVVGVAAETGEPWNVACDAQALEQLVVNLVSNAVDARRPGQPGRIRVELARIEAGVALVLPAGRDGTWMTVLDPAVPAPAGFVRLEVEDDGSGIEASDAQRIFEPFVTSKEVGRGTGLGLAIVHGTVQAAGGRLAVRAGGGACFRVDLPLV